MLILDGDRYTVTILEPEVFLTRCLLLRKESGKEYTVLQTEEGLASCSCEGFARGHWCKHLLGCEKERLLERMEPCAAPSTDPTRSS